MKRYTVPILVIAALLFMAAGSARAGEYVIDGDLVVSSNATLNNLMIDNGPQGIHINGFDGDYLMWGDDAETESLTTDYRAIKLGRHASATEYGTEGIRFEGIACVGIEERILYNENTKPKLSWSIYADPRLYGDWEMTGNLDMTDNVISNGVFIGDAGGLYTLPQGDLGMGTFTNGLIP